MQIDTQARPVRMFVGLKIDPDIASQLAALSAELKDTSVRRVAPADIHLTLVPPWREASIDQAIERLRHAAGALTSFPLKFQHLGYGQHPRRPTLVWVDCAATDAVAVLRNTLMQAFGQEDSRPFRPHVTLARIRSGDRSFPRKHPIDKDLNLGQAVRSVELFQSPPPGATGYQILASAQLAEADSAADRPPFPGYNRLSSNSSQE
jgi:2'-5' RNA ligase